MRKTLLTLIFTGITLTAVAADTTNTSGSFNKIGVGIHVDTDKDAVIRLALDQEGLRIEPYFGFNYYNNEGSAKQFLIGSGIYLLEQTSRDISLYYGGRAALNYADPGNTQVELVGAVGAEYFFDHQFSISGEVNAGLSLGDATILGTGSDIILRYYFQ